MIREIVHQRKDEMGIMISFCAKDFESQKVWKDINLKWRYHGGLQTDRKLVLFHCFFILIINWL